jgi:hypothetical protein
MLYIETTISVWKDDVCLFETDCECRIEYYLPDGQSGIIDWDVTEFHFTGKKDGKPIYTKIGRHMPLFHVLYADLDREWLQERLTDMLADDGIVDRYATAEA